ncbi:MCE family protein [Mycobacterium sp. 21AC1]|uniref:MCE family protein n=1 Tax=[Mycobacterium] appelbergii TaxID=2939269 RepID=UPI0029391FD7|nr:MCE family protein [Mycobacterium sp. 21AC1]MDV3129932.1 MCE family protein [Mycobacterium sp. 21AC1]
MKPFRERNPIVICVIAVSAIGAVVLGMLNYTRLASLLTDNTYSAYFEESGGLTTGAPVQVSGYGAGHVDSISLDSRGVLVRFSVDDDIRLGEDTEAAIKTIALLGNKVLDITPRGKGHLDQTIPIARTKSPYQLADAIGDLTATISGLDTGQLSESLQTLSQTLQDTPPQLRIAVAGVARFSETLNKRDTELRTLLANARKATTVLADRTDQIVQLVHDTNALLESLRIQSAALDEVSAHISALSQQIGAFVDDNQSTLKPALDKLNGVLAILDNRKAEIQTSIKGLNTYALSFGESISSGPFFKAYVANLLPGQFLQPFVDAAFSDLGLDPSVLLPTQRTDPPVGQPGTPALPVPYPRTGQGGEPRMTIPDAITGNPGDQGCGPPGVPLPGPTGCYPYREPPPAPPPGGPPPGPPGLPPGQEMPTQPQPSPVFIPAPGEPGQEPIAPESVEAGQ